MDNELALQINKVVVPIEMPVFCADLRNYPLELSLAAQAVQELRVSHPEITPSNVKATYSSPYKSHLLNNKLIPLTQLVMKIAKKVSRETLSCDLDQINVDLFTADCWCAIYEESDKTIPHNHFPSDFSAVVYLEAQPLCAPIIFANTIVVQPVSGSLVLFPGLLDHQVPPTQGRRVVVAMNLFKIPRLTKNE
jgi:hypothetical protein